MSNWRASYNKLQEYIAGHPTIEMTHGSTSIPDDVRPEFYRLFDEVRNNYVRENFSTQLEEAAMLGKEYTKAKEAFNACLGLNVEINRHLDWFLKDPVDGLTRRIFEPLFDLVKKTISIEVFEQTSNRVLQDSLKNFRRQGYIHWTTLSLLKLMSPNGAYLAPVDDESVEPDLTADEGRPGMFTHEIPKLAAAEQLALDSSHFIPLLVPKIILHSSCLNTYVAVRNDFHQVYRRAFELHKHIKDVEWHQIENLQAKFGPFHLWPDIGIYLNESPEQLCVIADYAETLRPDIIVDVMETRDCYQTGRLDEVRHHYDVLKPRLGSFVVCRESMPQTLLRELGLEPAPIGAIAAEGTGQLQRDASAPAAGMASELPSDIHLLSVGYETGKLESIIDAPARSRAKA